MIKLLTIGVLKKKLEKKCNGIFAKFI